MRLAGRAIRRGLENLVIGAILLVGFVVVGVLWAILETVGVLGDLRRHLRT